MIFEAGHYKNFLQSAREYMRKNTLADAGMSY
jgi:hypothetical protein